MPETTLADLAHEVHAKNAGPFWVTMELFMRDAEGYRIAADESFLNERVIAELYRVEESTVQLFRIPSLNVVKISFPARSTRDRSGTATCTPASTTSPLARMPIRRPADRVVVDTTPR
ncbi:DUF4387 family protein [Amycolatopsis aidingensis]|uniref:DUF4387 family protein n=1 Tax=Amycolatopsis aidingensis TaxID=2842453 RepID=UPI001E3E8824|nr:DUF4387 family protein [Amycolatopsis aidingensis]